MKISLDDLSLFLSVARAGAFGAAARRRGVPTSTLSRRVAALETALRTPLLRRSSRRVSPTDEGVRLLEACSGPFDEISQALEGLSGEEETLRGRLRLTAPVQAGRDIIGPIIIEFGRRHPALSIELQLTNSMLDLVEEGIDLAFRLGPLPDSSDVARRLWDVEYVLCASRDFLTKELSGLRAITLEQLSELPCIVTQPVEPWTFVDTTGEVTRRHPRNAVRLGDLKLGLDAAVAGYGVAYLPADMMASAERKREIARLEIEDASPQMRTMMAVYPATRVLSRKVRLLIDFVAAYRRSPGQADKPAAVRSTRRRRSSAGSKQEG